jgi:hypothetical protein
MAKQQVQFQNKTQKRMVMEVTETSALEVKEKLQYFV